VKNNVKAGQRRRRPELIKFEQQIEPLPSHGATSDITGPKQLTPRTVRTIPPGGSRLSCFEPTAPASFQAFHQVEIGKIVLEGRGACLPISGHGQCPEELGTRFWNLQNPPWLSPTR
jgi:hypothetical protein